MEPYGKTYNLASLFSKEEKAEHKKYKPGIEALTKFNELINKKTHKLIKDLEATNFWEVTEIRDNILQYSIQYKLCTGNKRRPTSFIFKSPLKGHILTSDAKLQEFLEKYKG
ncbi:hypothetical protein CMI40_01800 [Candidatus Pacearchaeota archaeon]|jgi:hypothetical protein|nr:hypothetical protein [Candidatus Pacearchaeota archaeon]|tara:strand:- start:16094 stop:16429 length:336 start_codon:yes stop_codon:yes gene_type:complete